MISKKTETWIINNIYCSVNYCSQIFNKESRTIEVKIKDSKQGTYTKQKYLYITEFCCIMNNKQSGKSSDYYIIREKYC